MPTSSAAIAGIILVCLAIPALAQQQTYRAPLIDASDLPRVIVPVDVRSGRPPGKPPARAATAVESQPSNVTVNATDFRLWEDHKTTAKADKSLKFRDTDLQLGLIVVLDASGSMKGRPMAAIRQGLAQLVSRKRSGDRVAVLSFANDLRWETRWDASDQAVQDSFRNLQARGNRSRLYDAIAEAMDEFGKEAGRDDTFPNRRCILIVSDGHDEGSALALDTLLDRVTRSRVRIDAAGLAHLPLWLESLRQLAHTGFGEFRLASTPEDLTQLLEQGIERLLDVPVLEFTAQQLSPDGKDHQLGIEHIPTRFRDQMSVKLPRSLLYVYRTVWMVSGAALLIAIVAVFYFWPRHRNTGILAPVVSPAPAFSPPVPRSIARGETVDESVMKARAAAAPVPAPRPTIAETVRLTEPAPHPKPVRVGTVLAPQAPNSESLMELVGTAGLYAGHRFPVSHQEFWLGAGANNHLCLSADPAVSGNHACIRREGHSYRLYDNGSLNQTWVNGRAIGRDVVLLQPGDRIRIGQCEFMVQS